MCGFAGIIDASGRAPAARLCETAGAMADTLRHRGPDDAGVWADDKAGVALGFRRLAILDLSSAGHQPFVSADGRLVVTFNGEIYNHLSLRARLGTEGPVAWKGHSDTETLAACFGAWGVRTTLERSVGMFALAVWDRLEQRLYLARDRFGEKPLYYGWSGGAFVFGSELRALRRFPRFDNEIDRDVLALYFQYCCVPAPYSIFRQVYKLEPGCLLSITAAGSVAAPSQPLFAPVRDGHVVVERYWSLTDAARRGNLDPIADQGDAVSALERGLSEAVRLQSIADVPLGAFLSGGIDSSTVVALMQAQSDRRVKTFTIGFEDASFDEAAHAKAVAHHLGTEHTELYVSAQQARDVIPALPALYSEPFADSSQVPTHLVAQMARPHVTVALSGDGADELFGGYVRHMWAPRVWRRLRWVPQPLRRGLAVSMQGVSPETWDAVARATTVDRVVRRLGQKAHRLAHRLEHADTVDALYRVLVTVWPAEACIVPGARPLRTVLGETTSAPALATAEERMMLWDALTYLPDDILHKVDRAAMGVSLETRAPFLDHRVAELAWRLPLTMKIRNGRGKWILREVLRRHLPPALIDRPKTGFSIPVAAWLRGPLRDWAEQLLAESRLRSDGYLNPARVRATWSEHLSGRRIWENELWSVLMFQSWLDAEG